MPVTPTEVAERVPVIEYHYSTYASGDQTIMRTEWFLDQLNWLAANGYHTLTGAEFAILPPQNASGNWVKVVQRLPVRVRINTQTGEPPLRAGMTAYVSIDTRRARQLSTLFGGGPAVAANPAEGEKK